MTTFKEFINEIEVVKVDLRDELLLEHDKYQKIPKTQRTYRIDKANTSSLTQDHAHVYASKNKQIYAVNIDGSGHDGNHGYEIPKRDAEYFRTIGFDIAQTNILENLDYSLVDAKYKVYALIVNTNLN